MSSLNILFQAISSMEKMGENWERVEEAIDYVNIQLSEEDFDIRAVRNPPTKASSEQLPTGASILSTNTTHTTNPELNSLSDQNEPKIPSELIAHCVSTLLMIQVNIFHTFVCSKLASAARFSFHEMTRMYGRDQICQCHDCLNFFMQ